MIEILILHTLLKYDCTIYRINKIIETTFFAYFKPSFGSLAPAVNRLEKMGCIEAQISVTEGGKCSKRVSITNFGEKYLKNLLQSYEFVNPSSFLNDVGILFFCSQNLTGDDLQKFKTNLSLQLKLYKNQIKNGLENPYNPLPDEQKEIIQKTFNYTKELEALCGKE